MTVISLTRINYVKTVFSTTSTLNLTTLKITQIIFFSDGLRKLLRQANGTLCIVWRILLIILKGFKGLRVDSLLVNDVFLLSNGLIEVQWKVRYAWTMRINRKQLDPEKRSYILYPAGDETVLDVLIRGLFRSYRSRFTIHVAGSINPEAFPLPFLQKPLLTDTMIVADIGVIIPSLPPFEVDNQALSANIKMKVTNFHIILPPLQTPTNHEQRLLHNT